MFSFKNPILIAQALRQNSTLMDKAVDEQAGYGGAYL
jgi:hypothetical protein